MHCDLCRNHATWEHTVFRGAQPVKVHLCDSHKAQVRPEDQLAKIKSIQDKAAKQAAVDAFLAAVGKKF